jgi:hypothetical protein
MSYNEIDKRIAIACGWELLPNGFPSDLWEHPIWGCACESDLPNYRGDLNAMHEAEKFLTRPNLYAQGGWGMYLHYLSTVTDEAHPIDATAAQRAEAFLRTIGQWEEDK